MNTRIRTWLLISGLSALFIMFGALIGGAAGLVAFLAIALVMNSVRSRDGAGDRQGGLGVVC